MAKPIDSLKAISRYIEAKKPKTLTEAEHMLDLISVIIGENTTLVLSTGSDLFKFLKGMSPGGDIVPAPHSDGNR